MEEESNQVFQLLDKNLERSNKLGNWTAPDIVSFEYWDVRYVLPKYLMEGVDPIIAYLVEKYKVKGKLADKDKLSFYFHIKDELMRVAEIERTGEASLVSRMTASKTKSKIKPSARRQSFPEVMELDMLSNGDPIKAQIIKEMKYEEVWETLLARAIKNEDEYTT